MTTAARIAEAEKTSIAFQLALTKIGVGTLAEALALWDEVPVSNRPATASAWLGKAIALIFSRRAQSRALARAYFRLARALRTGSTIPDPRDPDPSVVTLSQLRREFRLLVGDVPVEQGSDDEDIPVEEIDPEIVSREERDRATEAEIRGSVGGAGPINMAEKIKAIDTDKPADEVDAERQKAHDAAGALQAAHVERIAINGAREEIETLTVRDKRCIGYVRLSRTGTPCGWCAMLISRGPVYKSDRSGGDPKYGEGNLYHPNCHCFAEPIYSEQEFETSDLYALNRQYRDEWPRVTDGYSGKAAISEWRKYIKAKQRAQAARTQSTSAQEA